MPRLFVALELPHEVRDTLFRLRMPLPGAKWVEADNLHLTLRFAGDIANPVARELASALARIDGEAFSLRVSGTGVFGGQSPTAIWAGASPCPQLHSLQRATERAARQAGLPAEGRSFKPHITLARLKHTRPETVVRFLERHARLSLAPFLVSRFVLMSAKPQSGGGPYAIEETFPLAGGFDDASAFEDSW